MTVNLDPQTRQERVRHLWALKKRVLGTAQTKRKQHDPHEWANSFAGRPREFIGELIADWQGDDWTAWRSFISALIGPDP